MVETILNYFGWINIIGWNNILVENINITVGAQSNTATEQTEKNDSISKDERDGSSEGTIVYTRDGKADTIDLSKLENFLHPDSGSLRQIVEERVIKQPKILSEMLSVNFSDLIEVFQDLFRKHKDQMKTLEEIYIEFFNLVEEEGSEGIRQYVASLKKEKKR